MNLKYEGIGIFRPWKPFTKLKPWTIALIILLIVDSIYTVFIGHEASFIILWVMNQFDATLNQAMVARLFYCLPFLYFLDKQTDFSKFTFFIYIGLYFALSGAQFIL